MTELNWPSGAAMAFILFVSVMTFTALLNFVAASRFFKKVRK
jgi:putative spermidine/putrescine transport system permease protein